MRPPANTSNPHARPPGRPHATGNGNGQRNGLERSHVTTSESDNAVTLPLGMIVRGSLTDGLEMRLDAGHSPEGLRVGTFLTVRGREHQFFAMLSDVRLDSTHPGVLHDPPGDGDHLLAAVLAGTSTFGTLKLRPMLMVRHDADPDDADALLPVKTVPPHFSPVAQASQSDVSRVFGDPTQEKFFHVGTPLDMDTPVCLNLDRWVERSNAIFGKSGTGKTFLTRLCLCGAIKADKAVHLIFDMHSEYGHRGTTEQNGRKWVRGLKQYFQSKVQIFTLDPASSKRRNVPYDYAVQIPYAALDVEDILLLARELNLTNTAAETSYLLQDEFKENWLQSLLEMDGESMKAFVEDHNLHYGSLSALQRKLSNLVMQCKGFLVPHVPGGDDAVKHILETLQRGQNVVLEFGQHDRPVQYMLVANILTRRIHAAYTRLVEQAMGSDGAKPLPLVIAIEEAHKFLAPELSRQTIFGTIAREMRKYNVTLLLVDQRPSGIDNEVLSQVGTKICCLLDDENDIASVLTGVSGAASLRSVLASLETKQQALVFGHAVPMPVVIKTRVYDDEAFLSAMSDGGANPVFDGTPEAVVARRERLQRDKAYDF